MGSIWRRCRRIKGVSPPPPSCRSAGREGGAGLCPSDGSGPADVFDPWGGGADLTDDLRKHPARSRYIPFKKSFVSVEDSTLPLAFGFEGLLSPAARYALGAQADEDSNFESVSVDDIRRRG
jgi:hypothetical protein